MQALTQKKLEKLFSRLEESLVVVEGKHDEAALREVGLQCRVLQVRGLNARKVVEKISGKENVVVLTDFDREGLRKEKELRQALHEVGLNADVWARTAFKSLFGVRTVEELPFALQRLEKK